MSKLSKKYFDNYFSQFTKEDLEYYFLGTNPLSAKKHQQKIQNSDGKFFTSFFFFLHIFLHIFFLHIFFFTHFFFFFLCKHFLCFFFTLFFFSHLKNIENEENDDDENKEENNNEVDFGNGENIRSLIEKRKENFYFCSRNDIYASHPHYSTLHKKLRRENAEIKGNKIIFFFFTYIFFFTYFFFTYFFLHNFFFFSQYRYHPNQ